MCVCVCVCVWVGGWVGGWGLRASFARAWSNSVKSKASISKAFQKEIIFNHRKKVDSQFSGKLVISICSFPKMIHILRIIPHLARESFAGTDC